jgi:hypothetical protein
MPAERMLEICTRLIEDEDIQRIVCGSTMIDRPKKDVSIRLEKDLRVKT